MVKKIFLVLLIVLSLNIYSQSYYVIQSDFVDTMTGVDWIGMNNSQQVSFLHGMYNAYSVIWDSFIHDFGVDPSDEALQVLSDRFYIDKTVGEVQSIIDSVYKDPATRDMYLKEVFLWAIEKEYW